MSGSEVLERSKNAIYRITLAGSALALGTLLLGLIIYVFIDQEADSLFTEIYRGGETHLLSILKGQQSIGLKIASIGVFILLATPIIVTMYSAIVYYRAKDTHGSILASLILIAILMVLLLV